MEIPPALAALQPERKIIAQILPNLFLGSREAACNIGLLRQLGIRACVNCTRDAHLHPEHLRYFHVDVEDSPQQADAIAAYFDAVPPWVAKQQADGGNVLVYCMQGVSRSCTITLALLLHLQPQWSLFHAWTHVKRERHKVRPNPGFLRALSQYERRLRGESSVKLAKDHKGFGPNTNLRTPALEACPRV